MRYSSNVKKGSQEPDKPQNRYILFLIGFVIILLISLFFPKNQYSEYNYRIDDIVRETIIAPFDFPILKTGEKLNADREAARAAIPYVFKEDKYVVEKEISALKNFITTITELHNSRKRYNEALLQNKKNRYTNQQQAAASRVLSDSLQYFTLLNDYRLTTGFDTTSAVFQQLVLNKSRLNYLTISQYLFQNMEQILRDIYAQSVIDIKKTDIISLQISIMQDGEEILESPDHVITLEEAWRKAKRALQAKYPEQGTQFINIGYLVI